MNAGFWISMVIAAITVFGLAIPEEEVAEGVVIARLTSQHSLRNLDLESDGDSVEIWMVQLQNWIRPRKQDFILIEYVYRGEPIPLERFNVTIWRFVIREVPVARKNQCLSWVRPGKYFLPTAFWGKRKLPDASALPCFQMEKRPVAIGERTPHPDGNS